METVITSVTLRTAEPHKFQCDAWEPPWSSNAKTVLWMATCRKFEKKPCANTSVICEMNANPIDLRIKTPRLGASIRNFAPIKYKYTIKATLGIWTSSRMMSLALIGKRITRKLPSSSFSVFACPNEAFGIRNATMNVNIKPCQKDGKILAPHSVVITD